jgi:hypothetical protein
VTRGDEFGGNMRSRQSADDSRRLLHSIEHKTCIKAIGREWIQDGDDVAAHSVFWLYCWGKAGMNCEPARQTSIRVFDTILPISFAQFDAVVDHEQARRLRYAGFRAEQGMGQILARLERYP